MKAGEVSVVKLKIKPVEPSVVKLEMKVEASVVKLKMKAVEPQL